MGEALDNKLSASTDESRSSGGADVFLYNTPNLKSDFNRVRD